MSIRTLFKNACNYVADVWTAIREPRAMPADQRRIDEAKLGVGTAATVTGIATLDVIEIAAGGVAAVEGVNELEKAGHKWRLAHPAVK